MKAVVLREFGQQFCLEDVEKPIVGPGEVLVRVRACGICGTDLKIHGGKRTDIKLPLIMGHEIAGEIEKLGDGVTGLQIGDRGTVYFYLNCGQCFYCCQNKETLCDGRQTRFGFSLNGGLAEYLAVPARNFVKIPAAIPFEQAAILADAVATTYHALNKVNIREDDCVLVMGLGGLGLHGLQIAKWFGARQVIGVDVDEAKLDFARQMGFSAVKYQPDIKTYEEAIREQTSGRPVSVILETVSTPETIESNLQLLAKAGRLVLAGYTNIPVSIPPYAMVLKELSIYGSRASNLTDVQAVVELVAQGHLKLVVSQTYSIEEINLAFDNLRAGKCIGRQVIVI